MARRQRKVLPARKEPRDDDSLLVRSAESLGRVIGSLQRQMQDTSKQVSSLTDDAMKALPEVPRLETLFGGGKPSARKKTRKPAARKTTKTARGGAARKTAAAPQGSARKKSGSRKRSGARKASKKA